MNRHTPALSLCISTLLATSASSCTSTSNRSHWEALTTAGDMAIAARNYESAEACYLSALRDAECSPAAGVYVAASLTNLVLLYTEQAEYEKAEPLAIRALDVCERSLGPDHPNVGACLNNMAKLRLCLVRLPPDYKDMLRRAMSIFERSLDENHPDWAIFLENFAICCDKDIADQLRSRALSIRKKQPAKQPTDVVEILCIEARRRYSCEQDSNEIALCSEILEIQEKHLGPGHPDVAETLLLLASAHEARGDFHTAESLQLRALAIRERNFGRISHQAAQSHVDLSRLYSDHGMDYQALMERIAAHRVRKPLLGADHEETAWTLLHVSEAIEALGYCDEARQIRNLALEDLMAHPDANGEMLWITSFLRAFGPSMRRSMLKLHTTPAASFD